MTERAKREKEGFVGWRGRTGGEGLEGQQESRTLGAAGSISSSLPGQSHLPYTFILLLKAMIDRQILTSTRTITSSSLDFAVKLEPRLRSSGLVSVPNGKGLQYRVGSGQVWVGFGLSFGWIGVLNYTFRYFWVSFSLSGISGYFGYHLFFGGRV